MRTPVPSPERKALEVAVTHGCCGLPDPRTCLPAGHCLSGARIRHLLESDWIVVTEGSIAVGLAAYKCAASDVRVVHEWLVDRTLAPCDAATVTDAMLSAVEIVAHDHHISCLMFLICGAVAVTPFEQRGYTAIVVDPGGVWVQKKLDRLGWASIRSEHPQ